MVYLQKEGNVKLMNKTSFVTSAHAKCIIAGEHIVLRGMSAVVFPVITKKITLNFSIDEDFKQQDLMPIEGAFSECFIQTFSYALRLAKVSIKKRLYADQFRLENNIRMGAGIGFSAALCVVIARWLIWMGLLNNKNLFSFSHSLENIFHGKSSGLDIAGVMSDSPVYYEVAGNIHTINPRWHPDFYLSYSGKPKNTKVAIEHVQEVRKKHPKLSSLLDKEMQQSVFMVEAALNSNNKQGLPLLIEAMKHANHCFREWNLVSVSLQKHMHWLKELGAIAAKPTGAGEGGYVLSLWEKKPPLDTGVEFIPLFSYENTF